MIKIVADSSLDTRPQDEQILPVTKVPFSIIFDHTTIVDSRDVDLNVFTHTMQESEKFQSACPNPNDYLEAFIGEEDVFCITITAKLSGSHNSAELAKKLYEDSTELKKKIHIFDSMSASTGPFLIYYKIMELWQQGKTYNEIKHKVMDYIPKMHTMFISKSLENLRKGGRLSNIKAFFVRALNIVPLMGAKEGVIEVFDKARGEKRAFETLLDNMEKLAGDLSNRVVAISHADYESKAQELKEAIQKRFKAKEIIILRMQALNTLYADHQGIIISF